MEFISRPNFGPASELWSKAIQLSANRSNPMIEGVNAGMEQLQQNLGSISSMIMQKSAQDAAAKNAAAGHSALAELEAKKSISELAMKGQLSPMVEQPQSKPVLSTVLQNQPQMMTPMQTMPAGGVMTTHDLYRMMGLNPQGKEMAIVRPKDKAQMITLTPEMIKNYPGLSKMGYEAGQPIPVNVFQQQTKPATSGIGMPKAPQGFRFTQSGDLEPIPGGPAYEKKIAKDTTLSSTFKLYETARDGLLSGLKGSDTGPILGRIPAVTSKQQIAEGSIAAMAPVLKQLFRVAGEGVFTDRDQALLLEMIPKRSDHPEAIEAKTKNIDAIVRAKLSIDVQNTQETKSQAQSSSQMERMAKGPGDAAAVAYISSDGGKTWRRK